MTGRALQLYYTSCEAGLSGHAGFQIRAASDDLMPDDRRELEGLLLYEAPRNMPRDPDAETIAAMFPVAFRITTLGSGRRAILRSNYVGQDYSGRWGNFFAHALVLDGEDRDEAERSLVDAFGWSGWQVGLDAAVGKSAPEPLPPVAITDVLSDTSYSFAELRTFLLEGEARAGRLAEMIRAVRQRAKDSRALVIRESHDLDGRYWVACVLKAFPPGCQRTLTASTYHAAPRSCLAVNATNGETDFLFDEAESRFQFYVFDFETGVYSEVPRAAGEYAACVAEWMVKDPARLEGLYEFSRAFELPDVNVDLESLLLMYRAETGDRLRISNAELGAVITFARERTRPEYFSSTLKTVSALASGMDATTASDDWVLLLRCLAEGARHTRGAADRALVWRTWVRAFDVLVAEGSGSSVTPLVALRPEIERQLAEHAHELSAEFLSPSHLERLFERAPALSAPALAIVLDQVLRSAAEPATPAAAAPQVVGLLSAAFRSESGRAGQVHWALEAFTHDPESLASVVRQFATVLDEEAEAKRLRADEKRVTLRRVGGLLFDQLAADSAARRTLLARLKGDANTFPILLGEWERSIAVAGDKVGEHEQYSRVMLADGSEFARQYRDRMTQALLLALTSSERETFAKAILRAPDFASAPDALATTVLDVAGRAVSFVLSDTAADELCERIARECDRRGVTRPSRLELRLAVTRAVAADRPDKRPLRSRLPKASADEYRDVLDAILPKLLRRTRRVVDLEETLPLLAAGGYPAVFSAAYLRFHRDRLTTQFDNLDRTTLLFWLGLRSNAVAPALADVREHILSQYAERLAAMRKSVRRQIVAEVEDSAELKPQMRAAWEAFLAHADPKPPEWVSKVTGFFKRDRSEERE